MAGEMRPGDWNCRVCGDLQFARNTECRRCRTPKPQHGGGGSGGRAESCATVPGTNLPMKEGDWLCPACGDLQFARNQSCRRCAAPNPALAPPPAPPRPPRSTNQRSVPTNENANHRGKEMMPGDWICPNCDDLVFARNEACRRCGSGKAADTNQTADAQDVRDGDWICPKCGDLIFARHNNCRVCGTGRAPGRGAHGRDMEMKDGDWMCSHCGDHVFARNDKCRRCGREKPEEDDLPQPEHVEGMLDGDWICGHCGDLVFARNDRCRRCGSGKDQARGGCNHDRDQPMQQGRGGQNEMKDGDWMCPNCGEHVFARKDNCRRCGQGRPLGKERYRQEEHGGRGAQQIEMKDGDWMCPNCGEHVFARNDCCRRCGQGKPAEREPGAREQHQSRRGPQQEMKDGDWICSNCNDLVFARNDQCRRCGTGKHLAQSRRSHPPEDLHQGRSSPQQTMKDGDWICSKCDDLVFARNDRCRRCGNERPLPARQDSHPDMKEGDWMCPQCGDHVFRRNKACRRCGASQPDAPAVPSSRAPPPPARGPPLPAPVPVPGTAPPPRGLQVLVPLRVQPQGARQTPLANTPSVYVSGSAEDASPAPQGGAYIDGDAAVNPPAMNSSTGGPSHPNDWVCAHCSDVQFARNTACRMCGMAKGSRPPPDVSDNRQIPREGDWVCAKCGDLQFARNEVCRRCSTPKVLPVPVPSAQPTQQRAAGGQGPLRIELGGAAPWNTSPGDWICPNCQDLQFARNTQCRKCGGPPPANHLGPSAPGGCPSRGAVGPSAMPGCGGASTQEVRPGDWRCPACSDLQFARNSECRRCGEPRPEGDGIARRGGRRDMRSRTPPPHDRRR
eukprot:TRINITY_DN3072_c0_g1_i1.p1 TRINITY_DN3072_c0_g1~~TRINITY_DN3072_c0_g1_i1.p1  ORF type:complete len:869 (+),score=121.65 TRINITY_DN3072_c0_g1_i1:81-2609(+)